MSTDNVRATTPRWHTGLAVILAAVAIAQGLLLGKLYRRVNAAPATTTSAVASPRIARVDPAPAHPPPQHHAKTHPSPAQPSDPFDAFSGFTDDWNPFQDMERMREHMDQVFGNAMNRAQKEFGGFDLGRDFEFAPDLDLQEKPDEYVVHMDIPGADKSKIKINLEDRTLTVSGTRDEQSEDQRGGRVWRSERQIGQFQRSILLPGPVISDKMEAHYDKGVLVITVPKASGKPEQRDVPIS